MGIYHNEWPPTLVPENDFPVLGPICRAVNPIYCTKIKSKH